MNQPNTPIVRTCCVTTCGKPAEWEIWSGEDSFDYTEACTDHVGNLLGEHSLYRIYALPPTKSVQTATCARNGCGESVANAGEYCGMCLATMEDDAETEMDATDALLYEQHLAEREAMDWDCVDSVETDVEPPFDVQERAAGNYDGDAYPGLVCAHWERSPGGHCIQCARIASDPCHRRHLQLTASGAGR